jgi:hypothetical protein
MQLLFIMLIIPFPMEVQLGFIHSYPGDVLIAVFTSILRIPWPAYISGLGEEELGGDPKG